MYDVESGNRSRATLLEGGFSPLRRPSPPRRPFPLRRPSPLRQPSPLHRPSPLHQPSPLRQPSPLSPLPDPFGFLTAGNTSKLMNTRIYRFFLICMVLKSVFFSLYCFVPRFRMLPPRTWLLFFTTLPRSTKARPRVRLESRVTPVLLESKQLFKKFPEE